MVKNIKKRLITLGLALSVILVNDCTSVVYAEHIETSEEHSFSGRGAGTKENPYQVSNAKQLDEVRNNLDAYYVQTADIDLSGMYNWKPIGGNGDNGFIGQYNGNNHIINNLSITSSNDKFVGLFGYVGGDEDGAIKNINLKNVKIDYVSDYGDGYGGSNSYVYVGSIAGTSNSTIENCGVEGKMNVEYNNCWILCVGGISGMTEANKCKSKIDIFCKSDAVDSNLSVGGITAFPGAVYGKITNCINYGNIETDAAYFMYVGGISGEDGAVRECINYGKINGCVNKLRRNSIPGVMAICAGGITGSSSGEVVDSTNYGEVYCYCETDICPSAGGIAGNIGFYGDGKIQNCYSLGTVVESKLGNEYYYANRIAGVTSGYDQIFYSNYAINTQKVNGQTVNEEDCGEDTINGKTITEYPYLDYEHPEFTIGRDNNNFGNSEEYFFMGNETKNYYIWSDTYRDGLLANQELNSKQNLLKKQYDEWGGSCYGIAVSTLYAYNYAYDITNYLNWDRKDEPHYAAMDYPKMNYDVRDLIEAFQLSQYRSDVSYTDITYKFGLKNFINGGSTLKDFLKNIVSEAKSSNYMNPFFWGVQYRSGGHGLLICGYEGEENGYYKLAVCDPNGGLILKSADEIECHHELYNYLMIKNDYTDFHMENENGQTIYSGKIDSKNYREMKYFTYEDAYSGNSNKSSRSASGDTCKLIIDADSSFYASFDDGTYLSYDGEDFSGNANIVNLDAITNGDDEAGSSWIINIGNVNSVEFTKLSEQMEVDCLFDDDDYVNVSGENLTDLTFTDDKGVIIDGDNATYDICIGDRANDDILFGASGSTSSSIQYEYSGNDIVSIGNQSREDVKLYKITDDGYQDLNQDATYDGIDILTKGDIDFNGKVDIRDLQRCVQHVSGRNELVDKALLVADVNCDEKVNISDAMKLLYYVSGRNSTL
ncbi:dockerin type I domain-containing protein [Agathobacter sp.]